MEAFFNSGQKGGGRMRRFYGRLRRVFLSRRFLTYCLLGIVNTFNTAWISTAASRVVPNRNAAALVGYFASLSGAFLLNCRFVFYNRPNLRRYARFLLSYVPNSIIYFLVTFMTINTWRLPQFWATALASMIGAPVTFVIIQFYAFRQK